MEDRSAPVDDDLARLAERFVAFALRDARTFPHAGSVVVSLGGEAAGSVDGPGTASPERRGWKVCPAGRDLYGASSCPVNVLGPLASAAVNDSRLVYSAEYAAVTCAPTRAGPLPPGRLVVLRPARAWRSCASDFAIVLAADEQGRLRRLDLTLSEP